MWTTTAPILRASRSARYLPVLARNYPPVRLPTSNLRSVPLRQLSTSSPRHAQYTRFSSENQRHPSGDVIDNRMKIVIAVAALGGTYYVVHLEQVPGTGRWRFMDISPKYEKNLAQAAYNELLAEFRGKILPSDHPVTRHVQRVVNRILESSDLGHLSSSEPSRSLVGTPDDFWSEDPFTTGRPAESSTPESGGKEWNLLVVNDPSIVNAMATFGNIVVFTGILPICKDEQGLAGVLGHEIAHVVARHASERYSSSKVFLALAVLLQTVFGFDFGITNLISTLLLELPNSRTQEYEADTIGMQLTAKACFDPQAAVEMHARLAQYEKAHGATSLEFLRTHPGAERRIKHLEELIPEAYSTQASSPQCAGTQDSLNRFREFALR
ncbi:peptidase family M48-domain-containing protein [Suillus fuscotomentosus]|uniref:Peptidase family M48-domain-containing protein n=1 Tax=Suillus fuscotomentosus TaxID=1912939 RepID=A0AAD4DW75_9AGAM|nr:peptidase family M48-domain-containing protein [Suillus fuscotomentosus]KAG1895298.1 peptidase family M48-domain-containing protein [Suillus fuscotomentosus]